SNDPGGINLAQAQSDPRSARDRNLSFDGGEALEQTRLGFIYSLPMGEGSELQVRNYYVSRDFSNRLPFFGGGSVDLQRFFAGGGISYTHEGSLGGRPNRVVVGLDYDDQNDHRRRFNNNMGMLGALTLDQDELVTSTGLFVQDELSISDNVQLSFGLRFDEVEFDVGDRFLGNGDDSGVRRLDDVSPMIALLANLSPEVTVYGTYSTSFETPTTTEFANPSGAGGFNPLLEPQAATNLEIGLRGGVGNRTRYELAVFDIDVEDELIPYEIPGSPGRDFFANAGRSNRTGLEATLSSQPTDRIGITLSYTYADFAFADFVDDNGNDFSGNRIPGTVEQLLFAELSYRHPAGWFGALDALHVGDQFANNANTVSDDAYTLANLRLGFDASRGGATFSPFVGVNNVFDQRYNSNIRLNAFGGRFYEPGPGRNVYAGVSVNFDLR
ncbi:MAG: TonB-dependent receptor, partial [Proteobacteria bacterium]|nr:TonB-dependent receptor [Pseudomonadota bacterium]